MRDLMPESLQRLWCGSTSNGGGCSATRISETVMESHALLQDLSRRTLGEEIPLPECCSHLQEGGDKVVDQQMLLEDLSLRTLGERFLPPECREGDPVLPSSSLSRAAAEAAATTMAMGTMKNLIGEQEPPLPPPREEGGRDRGRQGSSPDDCEQEVWCRSKQLETALAQLPAEPLDNLTAQRGGRTETLLRAMPFESGCRSRDP